MIKGEKKSDNYNWNNLRGKAINNQTKTEDKNFKIYRYKIACIVEQELQNIKEYTKFKENNYGKFIIK